MISELSLFFPFYNEEKKAAEAIDVAYQILPTLGLEKYEVIAIDDGSKDETGSILESLKKNKYPNLTVFHHQPNRGYGAALKTGLYESHYEWICFTDGDLQFDLKEIPIFLNKADVADLVVGTYIKRATNWVRRLNTFLWNILVRFMFAIRVKDIDCGFKLIKKEVLQKIAPLESDGAFVTTELLAKAQKAGFRTVEVSVHHYPDSVGGSTGAQPKVIIKAFIDLLKLWKKLR